jgi:hypothetical protein
MIGIAHSTIFGLYQQLAHNNDHGLDIYATKLVIQDHDVFRTP